MLYRIETKEEKSARILSCIASRHGLFSTVGPKGGFVDGLTVEKANEIHEEARQLGAEVTLKSS
jgi:hypothetical protein